MVLVILVIRRYHLLRGDVHSIDIKGIILLIIVAIIIFAIIPCTIASIYHMVKAVRYNKFYYKEHHYAEWHYSRNEWISFIINNFKKNTIIELKSFRKAAVYYCAVMFPALLLDVLLNSKDRRHIVAFLLITLICFLLYFTTTMSKNIISVIDHILFTNRKVILMGSIIIVNDEIFKFDVLLKSKLIKKQIKNGNIEIEYAVPARYSDRYSNRHYLDVKDIKRLIIPIPAGKYEEAEKYIKSPLPTQNRLHKNM